jgi:hypothetical protein
MTMSENERELEAAEKESRQDGKIIASLLAECDGLRQRVAKLDSLYGRELIAARSLGWALNYLTHHVNFTHFLRDIPDASPVWHYFGKSVRIVC